MKRVFMLALACMVMVFSVAQMQRLALLPSALKLQTFDGASYLPSLCMDYFRQAPDMDQPGNYTNIVDASGNVPADLAGLEFNANDYRKIDVRKEGSEVLPDLQDPVYLSTVSDLNAISAIKKTFIRDETKKYAERGAFTNADLREFQNNLWGLDILERLGYVDNQSSTATQVDDALQKFSNDFMPGGSTATLEDVFAEMDGFRDKKNASTVSLSIITSPDDHHYTAFDGASPPFYRGSDEDALVQAIAGKIGNKRVLEIGGLFKNELKQKAFSRNIQSKLAGQYNIEVSLTDDLTSKIWERHQYQVTTPFDPADITQSGDDQAIYSAYIGVSGTDDLVNAVIEGESSSRTLLTEYFNTLQDEINASQQASIVLGEVSRTIRNQVLNAAGASDETLDIVLYHELLSKTFVHSDRPRVTIRLSYAKR